MNLPFTITHDELRETFGRFGTIQEIEVPLRKGTGGQGLGIAFIKYDTVEGAVSAFAELDKTYYQGRKLHILPAQPKPPKPVEVLPLLSTDDQSTIGIDVGAPITEPVSVSKEPKVKQSKFKEEKEKELKQNFDDEVNWNYLFMN